MATFVGWKDYYTVGDRSLDDQHRQIIGIINRVYEAIEEGDDHKAVKPLLDQLFQYSLNHFKYEEQVLLAHEYPELAQHKALHEELRRKVIALRENANLLTGQDLLHFLKRWWVGHIQTCDKQYAPYMQLSTSSR